MHHTVNLVLEKKKEKNELLLEPLQNKCKFLYQKFFFHLKKNRVLCNQMSVVYFGLVRVRHLHINSWYDENIHSVYVSICTLLHSFMILVHILVRVQPVNVFL